MQVAIVRTTIDRATGRQISEEIIGYDEIDEDTFYRPWSNIREAGPEALRITSRKDCRTRAGEH